LPAPAAVLVSVPVAAVDSAVAAEVAEDSVAAAEVGAVAVVVAEDVPISR
jgi:hypothetical protein